jgi:glycosyltransferase involved in cell wall biosynthesis
MKVLHLNTQFAAMGGVEAVLRFQHESDHLHGMDSRFVSMWEPDQAGFPHARFLGYERSTSIREARRRLAAAWPGFHPDISLHHTVWGQPYLLDLDPAPRRVLMLHSDVPGLGNLAARRLASMHGAIGVSDVLVQRARTAAPLWPEDRFLRIDYPVHPPAWLQPGAPPRPGTELVLGFAGRIESAQKRVERFIDLSRRLSQTQLPWRMEFVGDGSLRPQLEAALPDRQRHRFHGRLGGDDYWRVVASWDAIVFTSDFEGTPISLIEAITAGVLPFHPDVGCGGDAYARHIDPDLVYPPADIEGLAARIAAFAAWSPGRREQARARARDLASRHDPRRYLQRIAGFLGHIAQAPSPNTAPVTRRWFFPMDRLRFADFERIAQWTARLRHR